MLDTPAWPQLDLSAWQPTQATLHMWTQIVGKTRLALTPMQNHWWNVPLYVSARGLTTSAMPVPAGNGGTDLVEVEFDFLDHQLEIRRSNGASDTIDLRPMSVASFYLEYRQVLDVILGEDLHINPMPCELQHPVRFDLDRQNASYDRDAVERFHRILMQADSLFKRFATGFLGKISPVHFFWGSFDLCVTRFSGRRAAGEPKPDSIMREAYSHEVSSCGFWPGNGGLGYPAFYCYAVPVPPGITEKPVRPGAWNPQLGEFLLPYDEVRASSDPQRAVLDFLESSYAACADAAAWDRAALDRPMAAAPQV
jgi:hypothetical protein